MGKGIEARGGACQLGEYRVVFGEFPGKKLIGEAVFLRRAAGGERVGITLAFVGAVMVADGDKTCTGRLAQQRVQTAQRHTDGLRRSALGALRPLIELAQQAKQLVVMLWVGFWGCHRQSGSLVYVHG